MGYKLIVHFETKAVVSVFDSIEERDEAERKLYNLKEKGIARFDLDGNISIACDKFLYTTHR